MREVLNARPRGGGPRTERSQCALTHPPLTDLSRPWCGIRQPVGPGSGRDGMPRCHPPTPPRPDPPPRSLQAKGIASTGGHVSTGVAGLRRGAAALTARLRNSGDFGPAAARGAGPDDLASGQIVDRAAAAAAALFARPSGGPGGVGRGDGTTGDHARPGPTVSAEPEGAAGP